MPMPMPIAGSAGQSGLRYARDGNLVEEHPSQGVTVIPTGREDAARLELERLPRIVSRLPRDSTPDVG